MRSSRTLRRLLVAAAALAIIAFFGIRQLHTPSPAGNSDEDLNVTSSLADGSADRVNQMDVAETAQASTEGTGLDDEVTEVMNEALDSLIEKRDETQAFPFRSEASQKEAEEIASILDALRFSWTQVESFETGLTHTARDREGDILYVFGGHIRAGAPRQYELRYWQEDNPENILMESSYDGVLQRTTRNDGTTTTQSVPNMTCYMFQDVLNDVDFTAMEEDVLSYEEYALESKPPTELPVYRLSANWEHGSGRSFELYVDRETGQIARVECFDPSGGLVYRQDYLDYRTAEDGKCMYTRMLYHTPRQEEVFQEVQFDLDTILFNDEEPDSQRSWLPVGASRQMRAETE